MSLTKEEKQKVIQEFGITDNDTGSSEVQIAMLTADIKKLQFHFQEHKKDNHSKRGLLRKISLRKTLLTYLRRKNNQKYLDLVKRLNIRKIN